MPRRSRNKLNKLKPRTYREVREQVSLAARAGYRRAFKHTDEPSEDLIVECIEREVMGELCELVEFPEAAE